MGYFRNNGRPLDLVFGNGSDDDGTGFVTLSTATWNASTEDTGVIEKQYKSVVIPSGATITAGNRNSGIIIRCQGDCTISGSIVNQKSPRLHWTSLSAYYPSWLVSNGVGGSGGYGASNAVASGGAGQAGNYYGGGYGGGGAGGQDTGMGLAGGTGGSSTGITINTSIFVGGAGSWNVPAYAGSYGGGGAGCSISTGQGIGSNGGSGAGGNGQDATDFGGWSGGPGGGAGNYGGGVVIIYCAGKLTIDGSIICDGARGGNAGIYRGIYTPQTYAQGGGGGGGGRIYLMHKGSFTNTGTLSVSGGSGGYHSGGTGGNGTKHHISYADFNNGAGVPTVI